MAPSGSISVGHVRNVLARLNNPAIPAQAETSLRLSQVPKADTARYGRFCPTHLWTTCMDRRSVMRDTTGDVYSQLRALRLNGMATAWADLTAQGGDTSQAASRWVVEHLLKA